MPNNHLLINVTPDEAAWKEAAKKWHREFLKMPVLSTKDTTKFMTGLPGCRTNQYLGTVESEAQFYPYVANKRGDGSTAIHFEELQIFFGSMIHDFVPNDYVQTMLGEHADVLGMGQAKSEMAKLILTTIMEKAGEKLALAIPAAVRNADGNTTMDLFNGFVQLIEDAITDGKLAKTKGNLFVPDGYLDSVNIVSRLKEIEFGLDPRLRRQERFLYCDPAIVDMYNEGYLLTHPAVPYNEKYEQAYVEGSNRRMTFAPLDGLAGTGVMFIAPKMNVIYGYDGVSDEERFEVLRLDADTITVNAKMFFGVGFRTYDCRFLKVVKYSTEPDEGQDPGEGEGSDGDGDGDGEQGEVLTRPSAPVITVPDLVDIEDDLTELVITQAEECEMYFLMRNVTKPLRELSPSEIIRQGHRVEAGQTIAEALADFEIEAVNGREIRIDAVALDDDGTVLSTVAKKNIVFMESVNS